jgi:DNA-binding NtrC family response regulator
MRYSWPGNVRELENACERIAQTCSCGTVRVGCVAASILFQAGDEPFTAASPLVTVNPEPVPIPSASGMKLPVARAAAAAVAAPVPDPASQITGAAPAGDVAISLDDRLKEVESNLINWALKVSNGNKSRAAELLRIKRSTLGDRIARCGLGGTRETKGERGAGEILPHG